MKTIVIRGHGDLDRVACENWPDPQPGPADVLVRVRACGLNHLDLWVLKGMPGLPVSFPRIPGGDIAGEVAAVGPNAGGIAVGTPVLIDPEMSGDPVHNEVLGEHLNGGLCEQIAVRASNLIPLPRGVSFEDAACLPIAYGTAWRMMVRRGRVRAGESVVILGASGGVGVACLQIAKLLGATVYAVSSSDEKLARLRALGADETINGAAADFSAAVWALTRKRGADVVINFTGGDTWMPSVRLLKRHGRLLNCGATAGFAVNTDLRYLWRREIAILGSNSWERGDLDELLAMVADRRLRPVIHKIFPLHEARAAMAALRDRKAVGKIVVMP
ncbi:MAG: hypothetical protein EXQ86_09085 [Rhodospirillales bacterium]|nr:hypothetical protein [Rhodospirillales bacterium]